MKNRRPALKRLYRQVARAHGAQETERGIIGAATELFAQRHYDDVSLEDIAALAGVSSKTVKRRFQTKDALARAFIEAAAKQNGDQRDAVPAGDVNAALKMILGSYEIVGDIVIRYLALEERIPMFKAFADKGRELHLAWVTRVFAPLLSSSAARRQAQLRLLMVATDVYVWKLLRRDLRLTVEATSSSVRQLVDAALLAPSPKGN